MRRASWLFPIGDAGRFDSDSEDGTAAVAACVEPIEQLAHPGRAGAVFLKRHAVGAVGLFLDLAVLVQRRAQCAKHRIELSRSCHENGGVDDAADRERTESIEVAVESLVLAVPFEIEGDAAFDVVDLVAVEKFIAAQLALPLLEYRFALLFADLLAPRQADEQVALDDRFVPAERTKLHGKELRDFGFVAAGAPDDVGRDREVAQRAEELVELGFAGLAQNDCGVAIAEDLVSLEDVGGNGAPNDILRIRRVARALSDVLRRRDKRLADTFDFFLVVVRGHDKSRALLSVPAYCVASIRMPQGIDAAYPRKSLIADGREQSFHLSLGGRVVVPILFLTQSGCKCYESRRLKELAPRSTDERHMKFTRITVEPEKMGGAPCIRGLRIPVATVVGMIADAMTVDEVLADYPDLQREDIEEALRYAAEAVRERGLPLTVP